MIPPLDPDSSARRPSADAEREARADVARIPIPVERPPIRLGEAERELERLLRRETASLLRQAAALRVAREELFDLFGSYPLPLQPRGAWRGEVESMLERAAADGWRPDGALLLEHLCGRPIARWPRGSRLTEAARRVQDSEFARVCLGHALLCEGRIERAEQVFSALAAGRRELHHRWRVLSGLALAHEALGRPRLAFAAVEAAAAEPHCGVSTLVQCLTLALRLGDPERARRAAARLDLLVDPTSPVFVAALARMQRRLDRFGGALSPELCREPGILQDLFGAERSPAGRVARLLTR